MQTVREKSPKLLNFVRLKVLPPYNIDLSQAVMDKRWIFHVGPDYYWTLPRVNDNRPVCIYGLVKSVREAEELQAQFFQNFLDYYYLLQ